MKKRVLSLLMAVTLCFSTVPMTAFAQEADTTTEQETTGAEAASETVPEITSEPQSEVTDYEADAPGEDITDISGGDAVAQDVENAAALNALVAVQSGEHAAHPMCGATCDHDNSHEQIDTWTAIRWNSDLYKITEAGHYYLEWDVTLYDGTWKPADGVVLCLNGHSITAEGDFAAITVPNGVNFTLTDCNGSNSTHSFIDVDSADRKWAPDDAGTETVTGGVITHSTGNMGSGVAVEQGGIFTMYGGNISGNAAIEQSGGVYVNGGTFNMYGGSICGNKAGSNAMCGGGVQMNGGIFNMSGNAKIADNTASQKGGGVGVVTATFNMSDNAEITDNVADTGAGGGVYASYSSTVVNMSGNAKVMGNKTNAGNGGGVYIDGGVTFKLSGAVQIKVNDANGNKSNVYLRDGKTIQITANLDQQSEIGITTATAPAEGKPVVFAEAASGVTLSDDDAKAFSIDNNDNDECSVQCVGNKLYLYLGELHRHPICGLENCDDEGHAAENWQAISSLSAINTDGYYYLTDNVKLTSTWTCNDNVKLCLNGKTITCTGGKDVIEVAEGASLDITDCQEPMGKITHESGERGRGILVSGTATLWNGAIADNLATDAGGVYVEGTFTMNGGSITGNTCISSKDSAGGVFVDGTFTMNGGEITGNIGNGSGGGVYVGGFGEFILTEKGSITGNTSSSSGGGVNVAANGTFTMTGGSITGNKSTSTYSGYGGGVNVAGTFTMTDGEIKGNTSAHDGGGVNVYAGGTMKMSGGKITGNNTTNEYDRCSGGVYVGSSSKSVSKFVVSGSAQIQGNYRNGILKDGVYVQGTDSKKGNVYLTNGTTITIEDGLTEDARIGVSVSNNNLPTLNTDLKIATGATDSSLNYAEIFASDIAEQGYVVERNGSDLYLKVHQHSWKYTLSEDGTTITAACVNTGTCPKTAGGSITISRPEHEVYGDGKTADVTLTETEWIAGTGYNYVTYKKEDTILNKVPTDAGTYTASITVGGVTAEVTYEIAKAAPKAEDFVFTSLGNLTYDGKVKNVKVGAASGINGMGNVTVKYYQGDTVVQEPTNAGDYTVKIDVAEGTNYEAVNDLTDTSWQFTIAANISEPTVELNGNKSYIYTGQRITPEVTVTVDGTPLVKDRDYTIAYGTNVDAGENAGTITIAAKGNYDFTQVTKKFNIEKAEQTLSFADPEVKKSYGDADFSNELAASSNIVGTVTYASDNADVATVDENTGEVTIVGVGKANITATAAETQNYNKVSASYTLTVGKALIYFEPTTVEDKIYDGTKNAKVTVSLYYYNENRDKVMLELTEDRDYNVTGTFSSENAGEHTVNVKVTLIGDCAEKYNLNRDNYDVMWKTISPRTISIGSVNVESRSYNKDDTSATISNVTFTNTIDGTLEKGKDYTVTGKMEDANAGENKTVTVTVQMLNGNYSLSDNTTTTTVTIHKATPVINAVTSQTLVKNGVAVDISGWAAFDNTDADAKLTYALEGNPTGITLKGNQLTAANAADTAKEFTIKVSAASTTNFAAPADKTITVTVTEKKDAGVQINGAPASKTYGDADFTLTAAKTAPEGGTWSWTISDPNVLEIVSDGKTVTPTVKVKSAGTAILTVSYSNDDYYGSADVTITVDAKAVTAVMIADISAQEYTGGEIKPTPAVKDGAKALTEGTDYTFSYSGNINAGTATLTVTGQGNYKGTANKDFTISPRSISGAAIVLDAESLKYNGEEQTVNIKSVTLGGKELSAADYTIVNDSNKATNANGSITLTIQGQGNYTGTAATTWKITKTNPELADFQVTPGFTAGKLTLTYDGKARSVVVEKAADNISGMGNITVKYNDSTEAPVNAGSYKVTIDVSEGSNYNAATGMEIGTLIIEKAQAPVLKDIKENYKYTTTGKKSVSVADLVADATGYTLGEAAGDTGMIKDLFIDKSGVVSYTLTGAGEIGDTVTLSVGITSVNYEPATVKVVITLTEKDAQEKLVITGDTTVVYGQTLTLGTTGGSGTGKVTYHISTELGDGAATIEGNILTPVKVGAISITAVKAADADYLAAVSAPVVIIITQAASTGEPKYTVITTDGKTLADAGLTLTDSTIFPAEGTLEWIDSEGEALSEDTVVEVNKTYQWCFTPKDENYAVLTGEVELYHVDAPVISSQPESASVKTGEKATFEVSATGTDLTYQWMIDRNDGNGFVAISGADSASYTTGVTDLDCNGFKYYCVISNVAGSVTTDTVTLTVSENIVPTPEPTPTPDRDPYRIIDGADSSWTQDTDGTIVIRGNGEFSKFRSVKVDGNAIDASNYTVEEGSTIITLKAEYLKTLSEGSHTFELVWADGSASTNFTVAANTSDDKNDDNDDDSGNNDTAGSNSASSNNTVPGQVTSPKTGDASGIWITLFMVSIAGLAAMLVRRKKQ